ncbi:MAG: glycosyltransferase family 2 protein [Anaerolineales bacterium]|jgi:glycosyltransferase involved in cell wall biosynthesis
MKKPELMENIGIVVPAWNEGRDINLVLDALGPIEWPKQVVIVDDGSTDNTLEVAQQYAAKFPAMMVISLLQNQGKASAMLAGIQALPSDVDTVVFLDADLSGLTEDHLQLLIEPIETNQCEMSVAIFKDGYWRTDLSQRFAPNLNGQRCLPRYAAERALKPLANSGYGVEIGLTLYARRENWRIQYIDWTGMTHDIKEHKLGQMEGYRVRVLMYRQILATWIREWKRDN